LLSTDGTTAGELADEHADAAARTHSNGAKRLQRPGACLLADVMALISGSPFADATYKR
jgi:hypothetical protein